MSELFFLKIAICGLYGVSCSIFVCHYTSTPRLGGRGPPSCSVWTVGRHGVGSLPSVSMALYPNDQCQQGGRGWPMCPTSTSSGCALPASSSLPTTRLRSSTLPKALQHQNTNGSARDCIKKDTLRSFGHFLFVCMEEGRSGWGWGGAAEVVIWWVFSLFEL